MPVASVELPDEVEPLALAARDLVEVLLHLRREGHVDEIAEVPAEQTGHGKGGEARDQRFALPEDVATALDCPNRRRVSGRPADAQPLQLLDERRFGVPGRRRRLVTLRFQRDRMKPSRCFARHPLTDRELRQQGFLFLELRRRIVTALDVRAPETGKLDRLPGCGEDRRLAVRAGAGDLHARAQHPCVHHLRRHGPLPDQVVDAQVVAIERILERRWRRHEIRRPDGFVRLLCVLHLGGVAARS